MAYELIAMIFNQAEVAKNAWQTVLSMRTTMAMGPEFAVLLEKDVSGEVSIKQHKSLPTQKQDPNEAFLTLFSNKVFGVSKAGQAHDVLISEMDESFLEEIRQAWQPGRCALLIFNPRYSLLDTKRLIDHLAQYHGTLIHTTFPTQVVDMILEQSKDTDQSALNRKEV